MSYGMSRLTLKVFDSDCKCFLSKYTLYCVYACNMLDFMLRCCGALYMSLYRIATNLY